MTIGDEKRGARDYFWFALVLIVVLIGSASRASAADVTVSDPPPRAKASPVKRKPTAEELERRIQLLEEKLEAQQQATAAALQSAASAQRAASAAQLSAAAAEQSAATPVPPAPASTPPKLAQQPVTEQGAASATVSNPQIFAGPGGFSFQSPDGANQIRFHGEFDFDGRFYNDNLTPDGSRSTWLLRRARPIIEGTFANMFDFRFNPDFAGGKTVIQDAFVAARFNPLFIVTAGKFKEPFGLERLQLSPNNRLIELGLPSDLVPNRDLGLQISGTYAFASGTVTYQLGWFNGVSDGTSTDANVAPDVDNNDDKDWAARVFTEPFSKTQFEALKGLGAGVAVSYVNQVGSETNTLLPTYRTETQRSFFAYDGDRTASKTTPAAGATYADGERVRVSPQAYYYYRSFGLLSEYVHESQDVARTVGTGSGSYTRRARLEPESWQLVATYLLTGDQATFGTVKPKRPFAVGQSGWGAVEFAARISELTLDPATFTKAANGAAGSWFANPSKQANKAVAWTVGLNWYLTQNVAWYVDFTKTRFDGGALDGADRPDESAYFTRFQVAF
ncbi:MAG: phosphate-selective porin OprO and OprP [Gammaproteobacteria bacterium]|nr:phosphate-selective porin OprO and OprP [Gammaproteobacteria bacterium]